MQTPKLQIQIRGGVTPPKDMVKAAKATLGGRFPDFVAKYPGEITPQKLCRFMEES